MDPRVLFDWLEFFGWLEFDDRLRRAICVRDASAFRLPVAESSSHLALSVNWREPSCQGLSFVKRTGG